VRLDISLPSSWISYIIVAVNSDRVRPAGTILARVDRIELSIDGPIQPDYGKPLVTADGTTVRTSEAPEFCSAYVPFDRKQGFAIRVFTAGSLFGEPHVNLCSEAAEIAAASAKHVSSRPLWAQSGYAHMNSKLATLDPCEVTGAMLADHPGARVGPGLDPWICGFLPDASDPDANLVVAYLFAPDSLLSPIDEDERAYRIGGFPAHEKFDIPLPVGSQPGGYCQMWVGTDPRWQPLPKSDPRRLVDRNADIIRIIDHADSCGRAQTVATELVRLFKQLP
jgi:hypothetical protein